jgi:prephenate dehydrogenase
LYRAQTAIPKARAAVVALDGRRGRRSRAVRGDDNPTMRVALLGLGLIGGSIARALDVANARTRATPEGGSWEIVAWSPRGSGPRQAAAARIVAVAADSIGEAVAGADLIVLAAPPIDCLALLDALSRPGLDLAAGAVVTDVASTKVGIVERAAAVGLPFVGGHPMAGRETTGWAASDEALFVGRPWAITPGPTSTPDGTARVHALARACGARPVELTAADHDSAVAAISHLPLVVAAALVESVAGPAGGPDRADWAIARALAATGWTSATRLARGDVAMGRGIVATNGPAIVARLRDLEAILADWRTAIETGDDAAVERRFRAARGRLLAADATPTQTDPGPRDEAGSATADDVDATPGAATPAAADQPDT